MAHCVPTLSYLQLKVLDFPWWYNFLVSVTDRTSPRCEWGAWYRVTAWRTTCLYGVSYSRASPRLFDDGTSSVSGTDRTSGRCEWGVEGILSPHGALRAYTVFLATEPRRGSTRVLFSSVIFSGWRTACLYGVSIPSTIYFQMKEPPGTMWILSLIICGI